MGSDNMTTPTQRQAVYLIRETLTELRDRTGFDCWPILANEKLSATTSQAVELLPCPFCGNSEIVDANLESEVAFMCSLCGAMAGHESHDLAVSAWNRRATDSPKIEAERTAFQATGITVDSVVKLLGF